MGTLILFASGEDTDRQWRFKLLQKFYRENHEEVRGLDDEVPKGGDCVAARCLVVGWSEGV